MSSMNGIIVEHRTHPVALIHRSQEEGLPSVFRRKPH